MFDLSRFEKKLCGQLTDTTVGYEYAIYHDYAYSTSGEGGSAAISSQTPMTADRRMTTASMSKTVTAAAFMRAMALRNQGGASITLDTKMAPYLPKAWQPPGPGVAELTFKHLLTHVSGLEGVGDADLFDSLRQTIKNGATSDRGLHYQNCNYSLFRILIPNMLYGVSVSDPPDNSAIEAEIKVLEAELETATSPAERVQLIAAIKALQAQIDGSDPAHRTANLFFDFVRQEVLSRVGLGTVGVGPQGAQEQVLEYYKFNDKLHPYKDPSIAWILLRLGAGNWYMSAKEFARFIAGLRTGKIVSSTSFQQMVDDGLGMFTCSTSAGTGWEHSGAGGVVPMVGEWMMLPNGWTIALLVNSQDGLKKYLWEVIINAFNAALLSPPTTDAAIAAASLDGRIYAFIKADDDRVYVNPATAGQPFSGWLEVEGDGRTQVAPAAASLGNRIYVFRTAYGDVYVNSARSGQPFDGWGTGPDGYGDRWVQLSGRPTNTAPAAASLEDRIYVFARGIDSNIYVNSALDGQAFGGWQPVEGGGTTDVALAAASLKDRVYVFAKNIQDGHISVNSALKGKPFDGWGNGWSVLPGMTTDAAPAAASLDDRIYVFIKGHDSHIYVNSAVAGQAFDGWKPVEGNGTTDCALGAASLRDRVYVFAKGVGDSRIYVNSALKGKPFDGWGAGWSEVQW